VSEVHLLRLLAAIYTSTMQHFLQLDNLITVMCDKQDHCKGQCVCYFNVQD